MESERHIADLRTQVSHSSGASGSAGFQREPPRPAGRPLATLQPLSLVERNLCRCLVESRGVLGPHDSGKMTEAVAARTSGIPPAERTTVSRIGAYALQHPCKSQVGNAYNIASPGIGANRSPSHVQPEFSR